MQLDTGAADSSSRFQAPIGFDANPQDEFVHFSAALSQSFSASEIVPGESPTPWKDDRGSGDHGPRRLDVTFLGLTGTHGVLPAHVTRSLIERRRLNDPFLEQFQSIFNHRVVSHFYRAWEKYRFPITYERARRGGRGIRDDAFARCIFGLAGLNARSLQGRVAFDDEAFLYYSGAFARHPRCVSSLDSTLADWLGVPVAVQQFVGRWLEIPEGSRSRLPGSGRAMSPCQVGVNLTVGDSVWDISSRFRVVLGPLRFAEFVEFIPAATWFAKLGQFVRTYVGIEFDFDIQVVLRASEVPECQMTADAPPQLGWTTFLTSKKPAQDCEEAVFEWADLSQVS